MRIYGAFARLLRFFARFKLHKWRVEGFDELSEPTVFLVHHQNLFGPLHALPLLPQEPQLWTMAAFFHVKTCYQHYYHFTFRTRFGWPRVISAAAAGAMAVVMPPILRTFRAIPVHRGSIRIGETLRSSSKALEQGRSLLICPDRDYSNPSPGVGEIYTGFLHLEKPYFSRFGQHLSFTPIYCSRREKTLIAGESLRFPSGVPFHAARDAVAGQIVEQMNRLGRRNGDIADA